MSRRTSSSTVFSIASEVRNPLRVGGLGERNARLGWPAPPKVIVLTTFDADDSGLRALRGGAGGFLLNHARPTQIVEAAHNVARRRPHALPGVTRSGLVHCRLRCQRLAIDADGPKLLLNCPATW